MLCVSVEYDPILSAPVAILPPTMPPLSYYYRRRNRRIRHPTICTAAALCFAMCGGRWYARTSHHRLSLSTLWNDVSGAVAVQCSTRRNIKMCLHCGCGPTCVQIYMLGRSNSSVRHGLVYLTEGSLCSSHQSSIIKRRRPLNA